MDNFGHREIRVTFDIFCTVLQRLCFFPQEKIILETAENHKPQKTQERTWL